MEHTRRKFASSTEPLEAMMTLPKRSDVAKKGTRGCSRGALHTVIEVADKQQAVGHGSKYLTKRQHILDTLVLELAGHQNAERDEGGADEEEKSHSDDEECNLRWQYER